MNIAKRHLVLVGLSRDAAKSIREAVGTHGTVYHVAANPLEAMRLVDEIEPSVVLSAEDLSDGDGFDLCEKIKKGARAQSIGFMILTSSAASYNHGKGMLAGVDRYLETSAPEDILSEAVLELAEKTEKQQPLYARRGNQAADAPSEKKDTSELILSNQQYDQGQKATFYNVNAKTLDARAGESTPGSPLYHGYGDDESATAMKVEHDPLITHGIDDLVPETEPVETATSKEAYADPLDVFFADEEETSVGGLPKSLAPTADLSHLAVKKAPPPDLAVASVVQDNVSRMGPQIAELVTRGVDDWLQSVMGRRVDEALRSDARKTLSALILRTVDQAIRRSIKD
jgi:twitching motility two-component system response regulator PilG